MKTLTVDVKYSPKELAEICRKHGAGSSQFSFSCCPFPGASCPLVNYKQCGDTTAEDWEKVLQEPEEKKTDSWKVGDIVEVKNARDGKWYPGKILLIDKTSTPFFVQSEFGFKESSRLTRCLWCSEDQLRRLEEPEPELQFGDKVTHCVDFPVRAVFSAYKDSRYSGEAYVLFDNEPECQVVSVKNLKAGWE